MPIPKFIARFRQQGANKTHSPKQSFLLAHFSYFSLSLFSSLHVVFPHAHTHFRPVVPPQKKG